jgi:hypothetical protein
VSIDLVRVMEAMCRQGKNARECTDADRNHQQQTDAESACGCG